MDVIDITVLNPRVFQLTGKLYTAEQIALKQVKMIVDLIVRRDVRYQQVVSNKIFQKGGMTLTYTVTGETHRDKIWKLCWRGLLL